MIVTGYKVFWKCIITNYLVANVTVNVSISQGDDSMSVITCESDTEMVSFINGG